MMVSRTPILFNAAIVAVALQYVIGFAVALALHARVPGERLPIAVASALSFIWLGQGEAAVDHARQALQLSLNTPVVSLLDAMGRFGLNPLTAYFGLNDIGKPQPGETVVVSAAAGAVPTTAPPPAVPPARRGPVRRAPGRPA